MKIILSGLIVFFSLWIEHAYIKSTLHFLPPDSSRKLPAPELDTGNEIRMEAEAKKENIVSEVFHAIFAMISEVHAETEAEAKSIPVIQPKKRMKTGARWTVVIAPKIEEVTRTEPIAVSTSSTATNIKSDIDVRPPAHPKAVPELKADAKIKVKVASMRKRKFAARGKATARHNKQKSYSISHAEKKADSRGSKVLRVGRKMAVKNKEIVRGSCWNYSNAVYKRSGYPANKRTVIFRGKKSIGPYANVKLIRPGDWLYYINHQYRGVGHSAIFVTWVNRSRKKALMLSYRGQGRREPASYKTYDLSNVYNIIRPKK